MSSWPLMEETSAPAPYLPPELADETESLKITGFWMFLVTDVLIFASLFSVWAVYQTRVAAGPGPATLFHLEPVFVETLLLLTSSFTMGLALYAMRTDRRRALLGWLGVTMVLGAAFVTSEILDFLSYGVHGYTWHTSAFLSSFYVLVGTHGSHVTAGLLWAGAIFLQVARGGLTPTIRRKLYQFALYWHFLDIVWVFIFTVVYLGGKLI